VLNRFGLFDIVKFLQDQEAPGIPPVPGVPPPTNVPPPEEAPDEKIDKQKSDAASEDLTSFRRKHAAAIYELTKSAGKDTIYGRDATTRSLRSKFASLGIDKPFIAVFNQGATGLNGPKHIALLASLQGGRGGKGGAEFKSPGSAQEFADVLNDLYDDLEFETSEQKPTVVTYKKAQAEEEPEAQAPQSQPQLPPMQPQQPAQPPAVPPA